MQVEKLVLMKTVAYWIKSRETIVVAKAQIDLDGITEVVDAEEEPLVIPAKRMFAAAALPPDAARYYGAAEAAAAAAATTEALAVEAGMAVDPASTKKSRAAPLRSHPMGRDWR